MMKIKIAKIVSGGQSGVDRAALDAALELHIPCGGWCPRGRIAEDGIIAAHYPLIETPSAKYEQRTEWNVRDSDGTLVITRGVPSAGTALTIKLAQTLNKPYLIFDLHEQQEPKIILDWIIQNKIQILNIAGPRESINPGIYLLAKNLLQTVLTVV